jgi:hypothetical protein
VLHHGPDLSFLYYLLPYAIVRVDLGTTYTRRCSTLPGHPPA